MKIRILIALLALVMMNLASIPAWAAEDGAALYKTKCSACHGPSGEGKAPKIPALKGTSLTEQQIQDVLGKGAADKKAPHSAAFKGVTEEQAKAIAAYVKGLK